MSVPSVGRLLEDTLPDSLSDRLYAVRYLRESAQKLAAFVELSEFERAMQLAETWKKTARKDQISMRPRSGMR